MRGEEEGKMHHESNRFQAECVIPGGKGFNGNQSEFFKGIVYDTGIQLGLTGIEITASEGTLSYALRGYLLAPQGTKVEVAAHLLGIEKRMVDYANFHFAACLDGFDVDVGPLNGLSAGRIQDAIESVVRRLNMEYSER